MKLMATWPPSCWLRLLLLALSATAAHSGTTRKGEDDRQLESLLEQLLASKTSTESSGGELEHGATATATATATTSDSAFIEDVDDGAGNVTSQLGDDVTLHCRVHNLSDKVVSWLRRASDGGMQLLAYDKQVYISDGRYEAAFREPDDWQLLIRYANQRDQGHYECQVSSHPPLVSRLFLAVQVPQLEIADEREMPIENKFYDAGSTIELECVITKVPPHPSAFVTWRHGSRILNYDTVRGGIKLDEGDIFVGFLFSDGVAAGLGDSSVKTEMLADGARSRLFVANARASDSGNYTCSLADVATTHVTVQVLNGERPAAMQRGGGSYHASFQRVTILLIVARVIHQRR